MQYILWLTGNRRKMLYILVLFYTSLSTEKCILICRVCYRKKTFSYLGCQTSSSGKHKVQSSASEKGRMALVWDIKKYWLLEFDAKMLSSETFDIGGGITVAFEGGKISGEEPQWPIREAGYRRKEPQWPIREGGGTTVANQGGKILAGGTTVAYQGGRISETCGTTAACQGHRISGELHWTHHH